MNHLQHAKLAGILAALLSLLPTCIAQDQAGPLGMKRPRPYFYGGLDLDGNGSDVLDYLVGAGVQENTPRFLLDGYAQYTNTRKTDDNTITTTTAAARDRFMLRRGTA
jgi:hypothetical protein